MVLQHGDAMRGDDCAAAGREAPFPSKDRLSPGNAAGGTLHGAARPFTAPRLANAHCKAAARAAPSLAEAPLLTAEGGEQGTHRESNPTILDLYYTMSTNADKAQGDAVSAARVAVQFDSAGDYERAVSAYTIAIEALVHAAGLPGTDTDRRAAYQRKIEEYLTRAETLKRLIDLRKGRGEEAVMGAPAGGGGAAPASGGQQGLLSAGLAAGGAVVGATARVASDLDARYGIVDKTKAGAAAAAAKARQLDEEHKIRERTAAAARASWEATKKFEEEHKLRERTAAAARSSWEATKKFNEEHRVTQRASEAAKAGWEKTKEVNREHDVTGKVANVAKGAYVGARDLNEKYKVTDRVGAGLVKGLNALSAGATRLVESSEAKRAEGGGGAAGGAGPSSGGSSGGAKGV